MVHWYFDEVTAVERMREVQRAADRAQALGLLQGRGPRGWRQLRMRLWQALIAVRRRVPYAEGLPRTDLASSCQCGLR